MVGTSPSHYLQAECGFHERHCALLLLFYFLAARDVSVVVFVSVSHRFSVLRGFALLFPGLSGRASKYYV